jgi:hypothetical protein
MKREPGLGNMELTIRLSLDDPQSIASLIEQAKKTGGEITGLAIKDSEGLVAFPKDAESAEQERGVIVTRDEFKDKAASRTNSSWATRAWETAILIDMQTHQEGRTIPDIKQSEVNLDNIFKFFREIESGRKQIYNIFGLGEAAWNVLTDLINERYAAQDEVVILPWDIFIHENFRSPDEIRRQRAALKLEDKYSTERIS